MNRVSYDFIQKGKVSNQKSYIKVLNILDYIFYALKEEQNYPNNFIKHFWLPFLFLNDIMGNLVYGNIDFVAKKSKSNLLKSDIFEILLVPSANI